VFSFLEKRKKGWSTAMHLSKIRDEITSFSREPVSCPTPIRRVQPSETKRDARA